MLNTIKIGNVQCQYIVQRLVSLSGVQGRFEVLRVGWNGWMCWNMHARCWVIFKYDQISAQKSVTGIMGNINICEFCHIFLSKVDKKVKPKNILVQIHVAIKRYSASLL